jgi:hypothetical protein
MVPYAAVRDPSSIGPQTAALFGWGNQQQQPQQGQGSRMAQPDWGGMSRFADQQQRMNTPFQVQQVKDAFSGHANAMSGIGGQIGSTLAGNADRQANARQQGVSWAQNQNVLPFEFTDIRPAGGDKFKTWLNMNDEFQKARASTARGNQMEEMRMQLDPEFLQQRRNALDMTRQNAWNDLPLQRERMDMMRNLFGGLGLGGGNVGFKTNFGASGGYTT